MAIPICPKFHQIAKTIIEKEGKKSRLLLRLGCKQWQCPVCYKRNRELWRHHLMKRISDLGGKWSFWTVTLPKWIHKLDNEEKRAKFSLMKIRENWDKFIKMMKRKFGKFEYIRVFETHESGVLHVHFLASFHIPDFDLKTVKKEGKKEYSYSAQMKDIFPLYNWGFMHSVENLPEGEFQKTVGYVTKYMTKEDDFVTKHLGKMRVRRIQTSQGIGAVPKGKSEYDWTVSIGVSIYENDAIPTHDLNKGKMVKAQDFEGEHWYPTFEERKRENAKAQGEKSEKLDKK